MTRQDQPTWIVAVALLASAFAFRLWYGLSMPFWFEDERQVYLIGLESFARGEWPYFGADVVWTGGQVPGALLGMLIRVPLAMWPIPEAPVILLNILSFLSLAFFAWYLTRRLVDVPRWLIWSALLTLPWTVNFSTHVVNPSYVLTGAIVFFVGFFEGFPAMRRGILPLTVAWALMGAGLCFVMQVHMSWVLLPPYVAAAAIGTVWRSADLAGTTRGQAIVRATAGFAMGCATTGWLLVPTIARYGLGAGHVEGVVAFHAQSLWGVVTTIARVLSLASFEINRFVGLSSAERLLVLWRQPWVIPFAVVVVVAGVVQPLWMVMTAFRRAPRGGSDWTAVRILTAATVALIYASFFFSVRGPQAHSFYLAFPVAAFFAFSCWQTCAQAGGVEPRVFRPGVYSMRRWDRVAFVVIVCGVVLHAGLAIDRRPRQSLYVDRALVAAAVSQPNDRYLGDRRDTLIRQLDRRPRPIDGVADIDAYLAAGAIDDVQIVRSAWEPVADRVSRFSLTVTNRGHAAAWLDIRYGTAYVAANGQLLAAREGVIKQILQPGQTRTWTDIIDDYVPEGATAATITIVGAEKVIPIRR